MINKFINITLLCFCISFHAFATDPQFIKQLTLKNAASYQLNYIMGGQPSKADLDLLAKHGIKRVVNLRSHGEFKGFNEQKYVESLNMEYINIAINGAKDINKENLKLFTTALSNKATLVHCASGNRVGAFFSLDAFYNNKLTTEAALEIGKSTGLTRLEPKIKTMLTTSYDF